MPLAWTNMLYIAADTVRDRTVLEMREFQATWIGWAEKMSVRLLSPSGLNSYLMGN